MAKLKKTAARKKSAAAEASAQAQAERLSKSLSESAQQIWLAGVGAFGRAQAEGTKLFEGLVKEGLNLEQTARKLAGNRADVVRDAVESRVGGTAAKPRRTTTSAAPAKKATKARKHPVKKASKRQPVA